MPAWIDNVQRVMPKGEIVPVPILCSVTFGAPIRVEEGEERRPFLRPGARRGDRLARRLTTMNQFLRNLTPTQQPRRSSSSSSACS